MGLDKERAKEFVCRTNPIDRMLRWQRLDAATQRLVDFREVQISWNHDWTRPVDTDRTQPESGHLALNAFMLDRTLNLQLTGR